MGDLCEKGKNTETHLQIQRCRQPRWNRWGAQEEPETKPKQRQTRTIKTQVRTQNVQDWQWDTSDEKNRAAKKAEKQKQEVKHRKCKGTRDDQKKHRKQDRDLCLLCFSTSRSEYPVAICTFLRRCICGHFYGYSPFSVDPAISVPLQKLVKTAGEIMGTSLMQRSAPSTPPAAVTPCRIGAILHINGWCPLGEDAGPLATEPPHWPRCLGQRGG